MAIQRLTAAYRSRSRPSSTPGAKASTMCPSYLDGGKSFGRASGLASNVVRQSLTTFGDRPLLTFRSEWSVIPVWLAARRRDELPVGMVVQFSRSAGGASPGLGD